MSAKPRLSSTEFIILMAMLSATVAFSIDGMLPAMGTIADELAPDAPNQALMVITSFVFGLGVGTLFAGPLADAFGRKRIILAGAAIYCVGCILAWKTTTLEWVIFARGLQGLGAAGPRVATMAITRDLYSGRQMARVVSLMMMVFVLVPAIAPLLGQWIMTWTGWRGIFLAFVLFSVMSVSWLMIRQPETLALSERRPLNLGALIAGIKEVLSIPRVVISIAAQTLTFCMIFFMITTSQQVFDLTFERANTFVYWFAGLSLLSAAGGYTNSRIVATLGMRRVVIGALTVQAGISLLGIVLFAADFAPGTVEFGFYLVWILSVFMTAGGFVIGNLMSLAMEPLGHVAGLASSIISAFATMLAGVLASFAGLFFTGTPLVPIVVVWLCAILGLILVKQIQD